MYNNFPPTETSPPAPNSQFEDAPAENALNLSSLVSLLGAATKNGVIISDSSCRVLFSNPLAHELLNIPADYFKPGKLSTDAIDFMAKRNDFGADFYTTKLKGHIQNIFERANSGLKSRENWTLTLPSGQVVYFSNVFLKEGYVIFLVSEHTERAQQDALLDIALKNGNAGYWSMNFNQDKVLFSQHLRSLFTDDEYKKCLELGLWAILHPDEVGRVKEIWADGMRAKGTFNFTHRVVLEKSGVSYFHTTAKPDYTASGKPLGVTCFVSDVTQHHLALKKMQDEKEDAQKILQGNNEFLARMSHEIRTPMNGILGMTDALLHSGEFDQATEQLSVIKDSAINLLRILDSTLEHARISARKIKIMPSNHDPRILLKSLITLWQTKAQLNGTKLTLHIDPKLPNSINFDRFRLEQCMNNLLSNAVKFTANGKIQIVATFAEKPDQAAHFILAVKDDGIGMNEDQQSRVFTAFEQADESISLRFGGTGLGMPICKDIVELMGGNITLKSKLNMGSTFVLSFPCLEFERSNVGAALHTEHMVKPNQTHNMPAAIAAPTDQYDKSTSPPVSTEPTPPIEPASIERAPIEDAPVDTAPVEGVFVDALRVGPPAVNAAAVNISDVDAPPAPLQTSLPPPQQIETKAEPTSSDYDAPNMARDKDEASHNYVATLERNTDPLAKYKNLRILVVEDNETNQIVIKALLCPIVDEVLFAGNGQEGLDTLESNRVDLVLMDIHMPIMDGIEATLAIRASNAAWSNVGIIALTADPEYQQKRICRNIGMNSAISKPVSRGDLLQAFDEVLSELGQSHLIGGELDAQAPLSA